MDRSAHGAHAVLNEVEVRGARRKQRRPRLDPKKARAQLQALRTMLGMRLVSFRKGLRSREFREHLKSNRYLDRGTSERAYWHAGYTAAMRDVLKFVNDGVTDYPPVDTDPICGE